MPLCCIIRHGQTPLYQADTIWGWTDIALTRHGQQESRALGQRLATAAFGTLLASDLRRAVQSACLMSPALGIPLTATSPVLRPWQVGQFAGQSLRTALPQMCYYLRHPRVPIPPDGESFHQFTCRVLGGLSHLLTDYGPPPYALVTHRRNERVLAAWRPVDGTIDLDVFLEPAMDTAAYRWQDLNCQQLQEAEGLQVA